MDQKTIVIDTSVLLHSSNCFRSFGSSEVVIPYVVLEELDKFKTYEGDIGKNARQAVRFLNGLRGQGSLCDGVDVFGGGKVRVELNFVEAVFRGLDLSVNDNRILNT